MQNTVRAISGLDVPLAVWRRRKWLALLVFLTPLTGVVGAARTLPNTYESTATVLVQNQQVPERLVGPSASGELEPRLRTISQQILSRARLYGLITQFDLYPDLRQRATQDALVERMRQDIQLQFKEAREATGRDATIAFSLSYRGRDPATVAQVTNALAELYVKENVRVRTQQTSGTTEFLRAQLEEAKRQLEEQERRISEFKQRYPGELPDQQMANLATLERLNSQVRVINDRQLRAMERRDELAKRLLEIPGAAGETIETRLAKLREELGSLRARYTDEHPDVVRVKHEIAALERQLATNGGRRAATEDSTVRQLRGARAAVEAELKALRNEEQALRRAIAAYEHRVEIAPRREGELQQLSRDYAAAKDLYQSLLQRHENAQLAERMEQRLQGEQFNILDPAVPSQRPVAPHRFRLLLMGLMVSVGAAVGAALLAETLDTSFHTVDDLRAFTSVPVLVSIPQITTETDARRRRLQFGLAAFGAALGGAVVVIASSYLGRSL